MASPSDMTSVDGIIMSPRILVLEHRMAIPVLLYIFRNEGCRKGDVYKALDNTVTPGHRMNELESAGMIRIGSEPGSKRQPLYLTDEGRRFAEALDELNSPPMKE